MKGSQLRVQNLKCIDGDCKETFLIAGKNLYYSIMPNMNDHFDIRLIKSQFQMMTSGMCVNIPIKSKENVVSFSRPTLYSFNQRYWIF